MVYAPPENSKLFGLTVKDSSTAGYTFFLYKCTVRDFDSEVRELTLTFYVQDYCPTLASIKKAEELFCLYVFGGGGGDGFLNSTSAIDHASRTLGGARKRCTTIGGGVYHTDTQSHGDPLQVTKCTFEIGTV